MIKFSPPIENLLSREILKKAKKELESDYIILLLGMRQVGKTSLLYLLLDYLLKKNSPQQLFYFDLENINVLEFLNGFSDFDLFWQYLKKEGVDPKKKIFIFIDEIQYLKHPSSFLKYLHDRYKIKFIVSGSSSLEIKKKFTDRLTGRQITFNLPSLSFSEYLLFKQEKRLIKTLASPQIPLVDKKKIRSLFQDYALFGGLPKISLLNSFEEKEKLLASIFNLYVRKDIKDIGRIEDIETYNRLVKLLAYQIGNLVNEQELNISSGLSRITLKKYLFLLENTFVLEFISPFFTNKRKELIKMPKVYFKDTGLRNFISQELQLKEARLGGALVENVVFNQLKQILPAFSVKFWRTKQKQEVDFILEKGRETIPLEVKYQKFKFARTPAGLRSFIKSYQPKQALVITKDFYCQKQQDKTKIIFLPAYSLNACVLKKLMLD